MKDGEMASQGPAERPDRTRAESRAESEAVTFQPIKDRAPLVTDLRSDRKGNSMVEHVISFGPGKPPIDGISLLLFCHTRAVTVHMMATQLKGSD